MGERREGSAPAGGQCCLQQRRRARAQLPHRRGKGIHEEAGGRPAGPMCDHGTGQGPAKRHQQPTPHHRLPGSRVRVQAQGSAAEPPQVLQDRLTGATDRGTYVIRTLNERGHPQMINVTLASTLACVTMAGTHLREAEGADEVMLLLGELQLVAGGRVDGAGGG